MKLKFKKDHSPRKAGEVVEFNTRQELKVADWYLANGIAVICDCEGEVKDSKCSECDEKAKAAKAAKEKSKVENVVLIQVDDEDSNLTFSQLKEKYPSISARSKFDFLVKLKESRK